ncbi:uncharacterized protein LOC112567701 [Pomacea canaliculata]|uniref:uncharacterized protein LOC112567701 n=1 Tax=Pomacea canaliculata TaxID=400727 RepID=UPI000D7360DA|nr:uncharacterized protein LOC112567701 [Pomacea canaliculata]
MKTDLVIILSLSFLISMQDIISGNQSCSKLEFVQVPEKIVGFEGSPVNLTFYLDSRQCANQTGYTIIIARDDNTHICTFRMFNKCEVSITSVGCFCLSHFGPMLFTTNVANKTYIWKGSYTNPFEERRVTLRIDSGSAKASHVKGNDNDNDSDNDNDNDTESKNDNSMVVVISTSTAVCLVVIAAVIITAIACRRRVRRGFDETRLRHGHHKARMVSYTTDTPLPTKTLGDPATDIYDEIGAVPKRCRVSLKNGVSLPPIPDFNLYVETPCSSLDTDHEETPVEYLIPMVVSDTRTQETAEYRLVTCAQSLTTCRPLSSCL